jgi:site-specific DNA-methyltransferase (adenine-specific)
MMITGATTTSTLSTLGLPIAEDLQSDIYLMDCMEAMRQYPDNYFDLAVVDPPYGINASKPSKKPNHPKQKNGGRLSVKASNYVKKEWDKTAASISYVNEVNRISNRSIIFGGNYIGAVGGVLVWDKLNGSSDQYDAELATLSFTKEVRTVYYMWAGMFQGLHCSGDIKKALLQNGNKTENEKRIHPTQKPVALYDWIFKNYAEPGQKILDTHLGSGSSRIAAHKAKLHFTGFELDADYFAASEKRFKEYVAQMRLF